VSSYYLPARVLDIRDAVGVAAGSGFACALHRNGEVSCWGANDLGQLGNGTTGVGRYWPQRIGRLYDAVAISSGKDHSCAIRRGGSLSCWGWVYGTRPTTVAVPGDVTSVSMGGVETCITRRHAPVRLTTIIDAVDITADSPAADIDFMWAADPPSDLERTTRGGTYEVLAADPQRNEVVVDLSVGFGTPTVVVYDGNDRFRLDGRVVSLSVFESVLANEVDDEVSILLLGWSSRDPDNQADRTDWFLVT